MIGIIGGTSFKEWDVFDLIDKNETTTPWGTPSSPIFTGKITDIEVKLLLRHGEDHDIPPHKINHRANIYALQKEVDQVIGISSSGALSGKMDVPSISVPKDYINLWNIYTFYDESIRHVTPNLSEEIRKNLLDCAEKASISLPIRSDDVYVQTSGPRLETKAEVKILGKFGDLVGMTMAPEATLSVESGIRYASVVTVDNFAHGIGPGEVCYEDIVENTKESRTAVKKILKRYIEG